MFLLKYKTNNYLAWFMTKGKVKQSYKHLTDILILQNKKFPGIFISNDTRKVGLKCWRCFSLWLVVDHKLVVCVHATSNHLTKTPKFSSETIAKFKSKHHSGVINLTTKTVQNVISHLYLPFPNLRKRCYSFFRPCYQLLIK